MEDTIASGTNLVYPMIVANDGECFVQIDKDIKIRVDTLLGHSLCLVRDGKVIAIVRFSCSDNLLRVGGPRLTFKAYYPNAVAHPEYFEGLGLPDIGVMLRKRVLVGLYSQSQYTDIWWLADSRPQDDIGHSYFFAGPSGEGGVFFEPVPYVYEEEGMSADLLSYDELMRFTTVESDATTKVIDRPIPKGEGLNADQYHDQQGILVVIEHVSKVARANRNN